MDKEKTEQLYALIGVATVKEIAFENSIGSSTFSVQELLHNTKLTTLDNIYQAVERKKNKISAGSLAAISGTGNTRDINALEFQSNVIKAIYEYRVAEADRLEAERDSRKARKDRKALMATLKDKREIDKLDKMTDEEFDAEYAKLSNA